MCLSFPEGSWRGALAAGVLFAAGTAHGGCGDDLKKPRVLQGAGHQLAYAPDTAPIKPGKHFALEVVACPLQGNSVPETVTVDARMPAHGHGMTYRPKAHPVAPGRWHVEGLLLHMSGSWTISFEVGSGAQAERITDVLVLK
jgi:hypothetical protein